MAGSNPVGPATIFIRVLLFAPARLSAYLTSRSITHPYLTAFLWLTGRALIDRIYDVYTADERFYAFDNWLDPSFSERLTDNRQYSSREILSILGKSLFEKYGNVDSMIVTSYTSGVPVFCPAMGDSSLGFSLVFANRRGRNIVHNPLKDAEESWRIAEKSVVNGCIYVGGGTAQNFIQQIAFSPVQTRRNGRENLIVQLTTDMWSSGLLAGCHISELRNRRNQADRVVCYVDATIALPIVIHALADRIKNCLLYTSDAADE